MGGGEPTRFRQVRGVRQNLRIGAQVSESGPGLGGVELGLRSPVCSRAIRSDSVRSESAGDILRHYCVSLDRLPPAWLRSLNTS